MGWIMWNGISSEDMGLVVERMPYRSRAKLRAQEYIIPGRSGVLHSWDGTHEMITLKILLNLMQSGQEEQINSWLSGPGTLVSSDYPSRCWKGMIVQEVTWTRYRPFGHPYDSISVMIDVDPYMYELNPSRTSLSVAGSITGYGTLDAKPLLTISGTGTAETPGSGALTVGGAVVNVTGLVTGTPIYVDCDAKIAYTLSGGDETSANGLVEITDNEWPALACSGTTAVSWTGDITGVDVRHNWRWL